jgi:hypothetical protein
MKASRLLLLVVLGLVAVIAYLVRQRSAETGEDYATAARGLMADASRARNEAYAQMQRAVQDGRLAAFRREEAIDQDLVAAGDRAAS